MSILKQPPKNPTEGVDIAHVFGVMRLHRHRRDLSKPAEELDISPKALEAILTSPEYGQYLRTQNLLSTLSVVDSALYEVPQNIEALLSIRDNDAVAPRDRIAAVKALSDIFARFLERWQPEPVQPKASSEERREAIARVLSLAARSGPTAHRTAHSPTSSRSDN